MDENVKTPEPDFTDLFEERKRSARAADAAQADYYDDLAALPAEVQGADRTHELLPGDPTTPSVSVFRRRGLMPKALVTLPGAYGNPEFTATEVVPGEPFHLSSELDRLGRLTSRAMARQLPPEAEKRFVQLMLGEIAKAGMPTQLDRKKSAFSIYDLDLLIHDLKKRDKDAGPAYRSDESPQPTPPAIEAPPESRNPPTVPKKAADAPSPDDRVKRIQTYLKERGLYDGEVDGVWGPMTAAAVRAEKEAP